MSRRDWPLRFVCGHEGCVEHVIYRYSTKRDMMDSFELKHGSHGRWRCIRHSRPDEVLGANNRTTRVEMTVEQKATGRYFSNMGFISGPGFKAFADDFPEGTKLIVSTELILPPATPTPDMEKVKP